MDARPRRLLPLALALVLGACTTWGRQPLPRPGEDRFLAGPVHVTRADGSTVLLDNVTLTADSVVGRERTAAHARVAIATGDVRRVEAQREDPLGTAATVLVAVAAAFAAFAAIAIGTLGTGS
ncbi:MAG: hypothetical protein ACJ8GN_30280 [Longimicrobiaceae bacterium]